MSQKCLENRGIKINIRNITPVAIMPGKRGKKGHGSRSKSRLAPPKKRKETYAVKVL